jgi:hypothetical protein
MSDVDRDQSSFTKGVMFDGSSVMKNQKSTANKEFSPEDRYDKDPQFKALVDILGALIRQARFTPTELREAVKLAAFRFRKITKAHNRSRSMI